MNRPKAGLGSIQVIESLKDVRGNFRIMARFGWRHGASMRDVCFGVITILRIFWLTRSATGLNNPFVVSRRRHVSAPGAYPARKVVNNTNVVLRTSISWGFDANPAPAMVRFCGAAVTPVGNSTTMCDFHDCAGNERIRARRVGQIAAQANEPLQGQAGLKLYF